MAQLAGRPRLSGDFKIGAILVRKSTLQEDRSEVARSVPRQIEGGRAYRERVGYIVPEEYVFVDEGLSGAEFARRPGLQRLLAMLEPTPPFRALIISELSRLGRDPYDTPHYIKRILKAAVRIFTYLDNEEITLHSLADKLKLTVSSIIADGEREAARRRTAEALLRKARAGYVTGGRVFGYDNRTVQLPSGDGRGVPVRHHVER